MQYEYKFKCGYCGIEYNVSKENFEMFLFADKKPSCRVCSKFSYGSKITIKQKESDYKMNTKMYRYVCKTCKNTVWSDKKNIHIMCENVTGHPEKCKYIKMMQIGDSDTVKDA